MNNKITELKFKIYRRNEETFAKAEVSFVYNECINFKDVLIVMCLHHVSRYNLYYNAQEIAVGRQLEAYIIDEYRKTNKKIDFSDLKVNEKRFRCDNGCECSCH